MRRRLLFSVVFLGALAIAVVGWIVDAARWLAGAPARRLRAVAQSPGRPVG